MLKKLALAGVDVFRLNMSHGARDEHSRVIAAIRKISVETGRPIGILCDLSGPKIRVDVMDNDGVELIVGAKITLTPEPGHGTASRATINHEHLADDIITGHRLLLDDGLLELQTEAIDGRDVICRVVRGGILRSHKGVNAPDSHLSVESMTDKDRDDMAFGLEADVDMFAASFVRNAEDVNVFRRHMESLGANLPLISKVEMSEAVANLEAIVEASDGAMVARGDLGVEIAIEQVPLVQKRLISLCNRAGKPVITATQMLDSMIRSPRPTRAEATDVANAILDGTDAVMLSGETAVGAYPLETVETMNRIAGAAESLLKVEPPFSMRRDLAPLANTPDAIARATVLVAHDLHLRHILCLTFSGSTARLVARNHPDAIVLAYTPVPRTARQLCLTWGVVPMSPPHGKTDAETFDDLVEEALQFFRDKAMLDPNEKIVTTGGVPLGRTGTTNMLRISDAP
jgi:pyruvate kinase